MARWKARTEFLLSVVELLFLSLTELRLRRYKAKGQKDGIAVASTALAERRAVNKIFGTEHHFVCFCFANATTASVLTSVNSMDC